VVPKTGSRSVGWPKGDQGPTLLSPSENTEKYLVLQHFLGVNVQLSFSIIFYVKIVLLLLKNRTPTKLLEPEAGFV
jgi:hypothetical protein